MIRKAILALALLQQLPCSATELVMHTGSRHWPEHADTGERLSNWNPGIGIVADGWIAGIYANSYKRTTVYAGYLLERQVLGPLTVGVTAAAASGYGGVRPIGGLVLGLRIDEARIRMTLAPKMSGRAVAHVSVGIELP